MASLSGQNIKDTFQKLVQVDEGGRLQSGIGSDLGQITLTGSIAASNGFVGTLDGNAATATSATTSTSASYATSASRAQTAVTASIAATASLAQTALSASTATTASYTVTSSYSSTAENATRFAGLDVAQFIQTGSIGVGQTITGSLRITQNLDVAGTASFQYVTASQTLVDQNTITVFGSGSVLRKAGFIAADTASQYASSSLLYDLVDGIWTLDAPLSASLRGTASYALTASKLSTLATASYALTSSYTISSSNALTASYLDMYATASYALTASYLSGSINVNTGSLLVTSSLSGSSLIFTKGDGTTFDIELPANGASGSNRVFEFTASSTQWDMPHNFGEQHVSVTIYNSNHLQIGAYQISASDANNATAYFTYPVSGYAMVLAAGGTTNITVSGSSNINTGSFATTGSNKFIGNQLITGSANITGSLRVDGFATVNGKFFQGAAITSANQTGEGAHGEGYIATAKGDYSHAEGYQSFASASYSHAEGWGGQAKGIYSHAEGGFATSIGIASHAEGQGGYAYGDYSHAEGDNSITVDQAQHAQGQFNLPLSGSGAFILGNGTGGNDRRNLIFAQGNIVQVTGSVIATVGFTGSLQGSASFAQNAITASYLLGSIESASFASTASYLLGSVNSASYATTASYVSGLVESASYAVTTGVVETLNQNVTISGSISMTGNVNNVAISTGLGNVDGNIAVGTTLSNIESSGSADYGRYNTALGSLALTSNTTGYGNTAVGNATLINSSTGNENTGVGFQAMFFGGLLETNTAIGSRALHTLGNSQPTAQIGNTALGANAGRWLVPNASTLGIASGSIFIGYNSRARANSQINQIVIGTDAIGNGTNTTTIGNLNTTSTILRGTVSASLFTGSFNANGTTNTGSGLFITAPNGTRYKLTVDNTGALTTVVA